MTPVRLEPAAPRSRFKHSTTDHISSRGFPGSYEEGEDSDVNDWCINCIHYLIDRGRYVCLQLRFYSTVNIIIIHVNS